MAGHTQYMRFILMPFVFVAYSLSGISEAQDVTFESLLREMVSRDGTASFPSPGYRCLQASSYNRDSKPPRGSDGWFADSDGVGYIRMERNSHGKEWVIMEHRGPGCIVKLWTPFFYYDLNEHRGPKLRIYLDDSNEPVIEEYFIELLTRGEFPGAPEKKNSFSVPSPFASYTARAGDLYLPVPFARSCKITLDDKPFYNSVNYRAYPENVAVESFTNERYLAAKPLLDDIAAVLTSPPNFTEGVLSSCVAEIAPGGNAALELPTGNHVIRHLEIALGPETNEERLRSVVLRMRFDGEETVWTPVGDFFCSGNGTNPFHTWEREVRDDGVMICRWVMPYRDSATVVFENLGEAAAEINARIVTGSWQWDERSMHFNAHWRTDAPVPGAPFQDWNFVDISGKGVYVGDAWTVLSADTGWWGEGDEKIYIDGEYDSAKFPSHFGTGSEDYYGWAGGLVPTGADVFSMPFLSNVRVGNKDNPRGYNICTRSRALDAIPFNSRLRFDMEASFGVQMRNPWNLLHYAATTYFYTVPGASVTPVSQPDRAAQPVMTVEKLEQCQDALRNKGN